MKIFRDTLHTLLENDLGLNKVRHRHQQDRFSPTISAKTQRSIPKYLEVDNTANPKIERLRDQPSGKIILNDADVNSISKLYNIKNLSTDEPRECGTTGIMIVFDNRLNRYKLIKGKDAMALKQRPGKS